MGDHKDGTKCNYKTMQLVKEDKNWDKKNDEFLKGFLFQKFCVDTLIWFYTQFNAIQI